ncbi:MAG: response regulator transcription factor [Chloroflexi bacterium]|nr:response regulator transcription factor [Chloroflexota bacterium]
MVKGEQADILVVDDEVTIREVVRRYLERDGFRVREAEDGYEALERITERAPDLMVLDLMLPGVDGLTLTRQVRASQNFPIIMLTAKGETRDRILGLELGADDYVVKPFHPAELVSRVRAVLRRVHEPAAAAEAVVVLGALRIDPARRTAAVDGAECALTAREFDLLYFFARHPGRVFTRAHLLEGVWGPEYSGDASTVTVHIRRLREKIEADPAEPRFLHTVWGVGYRLDA